MELIFATHNKHKASEIKPLIPSFITLLSLDDVGVFGEIPETGNTIAANALQKARFVNDKLKRNCFADDTGLEVEALNGQPGVYSARYAGEGKSADDNMQKMLLELNGISNRKAVFKTIIAAIINGKEFLFEGAVNGAIALQKTGQHGFGYDPIFIPDGYNISFAQMTREQKNTISHRSIAVKKFVKFLETNA